MKKQVGQVPDYSENTKQFDIWAYHATYDGWWQGAITREKTERLTDGIVVTDENTLREYKECGFTTLFISYTYRLRGKEFKGSKVEKVMDAAHKLGLKCFVFEQTLYDLSNKNESLLNPDKADGENFFNTQEELNAYAYSVLKDLAAHPAFYGLSLKDEPNREYLPAIGQVYRAIQSVAPGCFVNMNVWGYTDSPNQAWQARYSARSETQTPKENYRDYMNTYLECTGAPYFQYDSYPLFGKNPRIAQTKDFDDYVNVSVNLFKNYEISAEWCKEKGVELKKVLQACSYAVISGEGTWRPYCRAVTKTDMRWQANIGMAFGQKTFAYWSYYPVVNVGYGELYDESVCFLDKYGKKNDMYYWMQELHAEMSGMAKALTCFRFEKLTKLCKEPAVGQADYLDCVEEKPLTYLTDLTSLDGGMAIVSELYDKENDRYGYFIVNVSDPTRENDMRISCKFAGFENVQVYYRGKVQNEELDEGRYEVKLSCGDGVFVMPYKK